MHIKHFALVAAAVFALAACEGSVNAPIEIADGTQDATASKTVNGVIRIGSDVTVSSGSFRSVNGSATVGDRSTIPSMSLVNGSIRVGEDSRTGELSTVNGSVALGPRTQVSDGISTVNGAITLSEGVVVSGEVSTVNGRISLEDATVDGNLENINGGVRLLGASVVNGDLVVRRTRHGMSNDRPPEIVIGPDAQVTGQLVFERDVELRIHRRARVGEIVGATPEYFGDDEPVDDEAADDEEELDGA